MMEDSNTLSFFRRFIKRSDNNLIAADVLSLQCYIQWLNSFGESSKNPAKDFSKLLLSHVRGSNGKTPFLEEEEVAVLTELNKKRIWPCFINTDNIIGKQGIYPVGFHNTKTKTRQLRSSKRKAIINNKQGLLEEKKSVFEGTVKTKSKSKYLSSYEVFLKFTDEDSTGCSRILSRDCFQTWVKTRRHGVKNAEHSFRKALIAHLCGKDGRRPFPPSIEPTVVSAIRKKRVWPCFVGNKDPRILNIGNKGFRHLAYHEGKIAEEGFTPENEKVDFKAKTARKSVRRSSSAFEMGSTTKFSPKRRRMTKSQSMTFRPEDDYFNSDEIQVKNETELIFDPINEELEDNEENYLSWDISSFDSTEFYLNNFFESKSNDDDTQNILSTFESVTQEEIIKVNLVKEKCLTVFEDYFLKVERDLGITLNHDNAVDISGDVKLLQFLRVSENSVTKTVALVEAYLNWREENSLEEIRIQLLRDDPTLQQIKKNFVLGKFGGCEPFAKQLANGDFVDVWQLQPNNYKLIELMRERVQNHIILSEYRSLVTNKLSYKLRRVVQYTILWDCSVIRSENSCADDSCGKHFNWLRALKDLKYYIDSINDLTWKWYGGSCKKVYAFGKGYLFRALTILVFKTLLSKYAAERAEIVGEPKRNQKLLEEILETDVESTDKVFLEPGKGCELSSKCLSVLSSSGLTRKL